MENKDPQLKPAASTDKARPYDPILDDPLSDSDDENSGEEQEEASSEDELEFPRENAADLMHFLHRDITNIQNLEEPQKRKFGLLRLYEVFVLPKNKPHKKVYQEILPQIQKALFKRFADKVEKNRELAALIVREFCTRCDDLTLCIPYLLPVLRERLNADDLEGIDTLPDQMKPSAEQKALVMSNCPEPSEDVRVVLAEILTLLISSTPWDCLRPYVDILCNLCRALCMDPAGKVILEATQTMRAFAESGNNQLIHFCEVMGRALFTAFVHKHGKVRIAGLNALFDVMVCGQWKTSVEIVALMAGFRDPNIVPIKDFYEHTTRVNYFAIFVSDRSNAVRACFYRTMGNLLTRLPDKIDHEGRLFPYMISGLFDPSTDVQQATFEIIEELGAQFEEENEEKLREFKQFGVQPEWKLGCDVKDSEVTYPFPILHRPSIGSRWIVRQYVRRYLHALYKEISDWIVENRARASHLMLMSIIYAEEFIVQFLDNLLVSLYRVALEPLDKTLKKNVPLIMRYLGRYCPPKSYQELIISAIKNELASFYSYTQAGSLRSFGYIFEGSVELMSKPEHFETLQSLVNDFVLAVKTAVLESLDLELAGILMETLTRMFDCLIGKQRKGIEVKHLFGEHLQDCFEFVMRSLSVFQTYRIQGKQDPETVAEGKKAATALIPKLQELSAEPETAFMETALPPLIDQVFTTCSEEKCSGWAQQNPSFRLFFALVVEVTSVKELQLKVNGLSILEEFCRILKGVMINKEQNQNILVKKLAVYTLFPTLVNKAASFVGSAESQLFMGILEQAFLITWGTKDDNAKHLLPLCQQHNDLISSGALEMTSFDDVEQFHALLLTLRKIYKTNEMVNKQAGARVLKRYLQLFKEQLLDKMPNDEMRTEELAKTKFLADVTDDLLVLLADFHDGVREEACQSLMLIGQSYLTFNADFSTEQADQLRILRANISQGWSNEMSAPVRGMADIEKDVSKFMFTDAHAFVSKAITIMMDEVSTREAIGRFLMRLNECLPFLLMNDFRVSHANNSLQRLQVLKRLLAPK